MCDCDETEDEPDCEVCDCLCGGTALSVCFCCDKRACERCSTRRRWYHWGRKRICNDCQRDHDGSDKIVRRRLLRLAGY
jgi:hypothetical protein